jgi:YD repeat-containing protein
VVDVRKPSSLVHLTGTPVGFFNTTEEAYVARKSYLLTIWPGARFTDLRACEPPVQYGYVWDVPINWCYEVDSHPNDAYGFSLNSSDIAMEFGCPSGYTLRNNYPVSGGGWGPIPYVFELRCEKSLPVSDPRVCTKCGNPINADDGSKVQTEIDYVDPKGTLTFARTYDSKRGGFAPNFFAELLPPTKAATASCAVMNVSKEAWGTRKFCVDQINPDGASASYTSPEGHRHDISWNGSSATPLLAYNKDRLALGDSGNWVLARPGEQRLLSFSPNGRLVSVDFIDGRRAQLSYSAGAIPGVAPAAGYLTAIADSFGRTISLQYAESGLLARLVDPEGLAIQYEHEALFQAQASLRARTAKPTQVTYQDGGFTSYLWDEASHLSGTTTNTNLLTGLIDGNGDRFADYHYLNGKAVSTEHAGGVEKYSVTDTRSTSGVGAIAVTDPLGVTRTWQLALVAGMPRITSQSQPAASGSAAASTAFAYDANGNVVSKTDFNGNKSCHANDLARNLETTRVEGLGSAITCSTVTAIGATLPAGARKTSTQWHPDWNLQAVRAEPGKITTFVYNGQPDPTSEGNPAANCAPPTAVLPDGKPIVVLCKQVEHATADATGALGFGASPTGTPRTWTYTYNEHGQVLTARDPLNNLTTYTYHAETTADYTKGDLKSVTNPAGHATQYTRYDKSGRLLESVDANGTKTETTYTPRGWVKTVTVTPPGAAAQLTVYDYDGVGQLKKATLSDGTALEYAYDAAHRLRSIKDAAGNAVTYTLDNTGNRTGEELKDASGTLARNITRVYDALNRVQSATGTAP